MNNLQAFRFRVDVSEISERIGVARELVEEKVIPAVELLSISSHAFIVGKANQKFASDDFKRKFYLGLGEYGKDASGTSTKDPRVDQTSKHIRWVKVGDGLWVVELDERARWLEEGRPETFMGEWLLKPGAKGVKRAKDGSLYRAIPFKQSENGRTPAGSNPLLSQIVKDYAKMNKVNLKRIEKDARGVPKLGKVQTLDIRPHDAPGYAPGLLYSKPRSQETADKIGLKAHEGIFKLAGAAIFQNVYEKGKLVTDKRKAEKLVASKKGKVKREVVTFRVISTKHKAEGRWMYPEVAPANLFQEAYDHANQQWSLIVKSIEEALAE